MNGANASAPTGERLLAVRELGVRAADRRLVDALSLELHAGEFLAVLGCNGSGKTLLLHTLAGLRPPAGGTLQWRGQAYAALGRRALAQRIGLLLQEQDGVWPCTALESVLIGRHPHLGLWQIESGADLALARRSLGQLGIAALADRLLATLSGGERQRVAIAALLAQQPELYLLDEPANHLDPRQQLVALDLVRARCDAGGSCVAALHDAAQADRYADRVLLLYGDGRWRLGAVAELLSADTLGELYGAPMRALGSARRRAFIPA